MSDEGGPVFHWAKPSLTGADACCEAHRLDLQCGDSWCGAEVVLLGDEPSGAIRVIGSDRLKERIALVTCGECLARSMHWHAIWAARSAARIKQIVQHPGRAAPAGAFAAYPDAALRDD